jgi:uncharacterized damage-inducible protein DinB
VNNDPGLVFLDCSARKLEQLAARIEACLEKLIYEQIWARGSDSENAIGNLILHLAGNVRQWIGFGVEGRPDTRQRDAEFAARGQLQPAALLETLNATVAEAVIAIRQLPPERLLETITVQAYTLTVMEAVYHVVEHFSQHTGQIIFATKQLTGLDLAFYRHLSSSAPHGQKTP